MKHKIIIKIVALIVLAFFTPTLVYSDEGAIKSGIIGVLMFGLDRFNLSELSTRLEDKGFETVANNNASFGGGFYKIFGDNILIGLEGLYAQQNVFRDTFKATVSALYEFINLGYVVYSKRDLWLFPMVGLGGSSVNLRILERGITPTFDEILDNPGRETKIWTGGISPQQFTVQFALGMDYILKLNEDKKGEGGWLFGIRVGYTYTPTKANWRMEDVDVLGGPDVGITGLYIHLLIGKKLFEK